MSNLSVTYDQEATLFDLIQQWGARPCPLQRQVAVDALNHAKTLRLRWLDRITVAELSESGEPPHVLVDLE